MPSSKTRDTLRLLGIGTDALKSALLGGARFERKIDATWQTHRRPRLSRWIVTGLTGTPMAGYGVSEK